jgi:hypothetical protein
MQKIPTIKLQLARSQQLILDSLLLLEQEIDNLPEAVFWQLAAAQRHRIREAQTTGPRIHLRMFFAPLEEELGKKFLPTDFQLVQMSRALTNVESLGLVTCTRDGRGRATHARLTPAGRRLANK